MEEIRGIGASAEVSMAACMVLPKLPKFREDLVIPKSLVKSEIKRFEAAVKSLDSAFDKCIAACKDNITACQLLLVHKSLLNDCDFQSEIKNRIIDGSDSVSAVIRVAEEKTAELQKLDSQYISERSADIREVAQKLICELTGFRLPDVCGIKKPVILVADNIPLSLLVSQHSSKIKGIVAGLGGKTSHTAIIAQNMGIAAVVGCGSTINELQNGEMIFVDGIKGSVFYRINSQQQLMLQKHINQIVNYNLHLSSYAEKPTQTKDGKPVLLCANIIDISSYGKLADINSDGIGLFRTEFLYTENSTMPSENQQFVIYKNIVSNMKEKSVVIRTLDIGGDKRVPFITLKQEDNPFMGYRAIRICLNNTELFKTQIKAILRAAVFGNAKIMFPMVSSISELRQAKQILSSCIDELRSDGIPCCETIETGIMIEIPSAVVMADALIKECDFFSIGSNDLTQYIMAVDRMNSKVDYLYSHFEPAVLRMINTTISACKKAGKICALCGEMAEDTMAVPVLLGMGLSEFSVSPYSMLRVRKLISLIDSRKAESAAEYILSLTSRSEIEEYINSVFSDEFELLLKY
ncbi:MAG TPA: phosphoenolpyruvate--protein phosphotransferase [Ruminococcaceae bacterium]|nr:phosphoenolpyruvate--protein phosphotransferase [Oscillospiraceae bacterium]